MPRDLPEARVDDFVVFHDAYHYFEARFEIEAAGSIIGMAHGHQTRVGKAHEWWAKMGHANHRIGAAHILLTGHYHHLRLHEEAHKLHVQAGAMDAGSPWFDQKHGGAPGHGGAVTFYTREGKWTGLEIL